jgi:hypothetical protein
MKPLRKLVPPPCGDVIDLPSDPQTNMSLLVEGLVHQPAHAVAEQRKNSSGKVSRITLKSPVEHRGATVAEVAEVVSQRMQRGN